MKDQTNTSKSYQSVVTKQLVVNEEDRDVFKVLRYEDNLYLCLCFGATGDSLQQKTIIEISKYLYERLKNKYKGQHIKFTLENENITYEVLENDNSPLSIRTATSVTVEGKKLSNKRLLSDNNVPIQGNGIQFINYNGKFYKKDKNGNCAHVRIYAPKAKREEIIHISQLTEEIKSPEQLTEPCSQPTHDSFLRATHLPGDESDFQLFSSQPFEEENKTSSEAPSFKKQKLDSTQPTLTEPWSQPTHDPFLRATHLPGNDFNYPQETYHFLNYDPMRPRGVLIHANQSTQMIYSLPQETGNHTQQPITHLGLSHTANLPPPASPRHNNNNFFQSRSITQQKCTVHNASIVGTSLQMFPRPHAIDMPEYVQSEPKKSTSNTSRNITHSEVEILKFEIHGDPKIERDLEKIQKSNSDVRYLYLQIGHNKYVIETTAAIIKFLNNYIPYGYSLYFTIKDGKTINCDIIPSDEAQLKKNGSIYNSAINSRILTTADAPINNHMKFYVNSFDGNLYFKNDEGCYVLALAKSAQRYRKSKASKQPMYQETTVTDQPVEAAPKPDEDFIDIDTNEFLNFEDYDDNSPDPQTRRI